MRGEGSRCNGATMPALSRVLRKSSAKKRSLTDDEVYALTAYILAENKLIGANDTMNAQTLPKVKMPNRDNFIIRFPDRI